MAVRRAGAGKGRGRRARTGSAGWPSSKDRPTRSAPVSATSAAMASAVLPSRAQSSTSTPGPPTRGRPGAAATRAAGRGCRPRPTGTGSGREQRGHEQPQGGGAADGGHRSAGPAVPAEALQHGPRRGRRVAPDGPVGDHQAEARFAADLRGFALAALPPPPTARRPPPRASTGCRNRPVWLSAP